MTTTFDEIEDFESLPESFPVYTHLMAGAIAGIVEHATLFPVDTIKVNIQYIVFIITRCY